MEVLLRRQSSWENVISSMHVVSNIPPGPINPIHWTLQFFFESSFPTTNMVGGGYSVFSDISPFCVRGYIDTTTFSIKLEKCYIDGVANIFSITY